MIQITDAIEIWFDFINFTTAKNSKLLQKKSYIAVKLLTAD